jgi:hypothetical protein
MLLNQVAVPFTRHDTQPYRQLLNDEKDRRKDQLQQQELVTPLCAAVITRPASVSANITTMPGPVTAAKRTQRAR